MRILFYLFFVITLKELHILKVFYLLMFHGEYGIAVSFFLIAFACMTCSVLMFACMSCSVLMFACMSCSVLMFVCMSCSVLMFACMRCSVLMFTCMRCSVLMGNVERSGGNFNTPFETKLLNFKKNLIL